MKFNLLVFILLFVNSFSFSQSNKKTKLVNIKGTKVSLDPPSGFSPAQDFLGFEKEDAMITVMDLAGGNYYSNTATFTQSAFEEKGVTVLDYNEITLNGYPAKFIHIQGKPATKSYNLVFGDSTFSVMVLAVYPTKEKEVGDALKTSLMTSRYDKTKVIDPFSIATFELDESKSIFKFSQATSNMFVYTIGGKKENINGEPLILIVPMPSVEHESAAATCEQMVVGLQSQGLENIVMASKNELNINGYESFEILVSGEMEEQPTYILTQVIIKGKRQVIIQGIMNGGIQNIDDIRALSATLKFK